MHDSVWLRMDWWQETERQRVRPDQINNGITYVKCQRISPPVPLIHKKKRKSSNTQRHWSFYQCWKAITHGEHPHEKFASGIVTGLRADPEIAVLGRHGLYLPSSSSQVHPFPKVPFPIIRPNKTPPFFSLSLAREQRPFASASSCVFWRRGMQQQQQ